MEDDGVDLALADKGEFFPAHGFTGFVEAEEDFGFLEEGGFAGIDVFSAFVIRAENSGGESDDVAVVVVDGEGKLVVEFGVESGAWISFSLSPPRRALRTSRPLKPCSLTSWKYFVEFRGAHPMSHFSAVSLLKPRALR